VTAGSVARGVTRIHVRLHHQGQQLQSDDMGHSDCEPDVALQPHTAAHADCIDAAAS
jgi:hypothetical protein